MDSDYKVYIHKNKINNKVYVGISCQKNINHRWDNGNGYKYNSYFYNAIKKHGWNEGFEHRIVFNNLSKNEAEELEILLIKILKANNRKYGYNISNGGSANGKCSSSTRLLMSEQRKGCKLSESTKIKISENHADVSGEKHPMYGKQITKEHKEKLIKSREKEINQYDLLGKLIHTYTSATNASFLTHVGRTDITKCCKGKYKTAGGYVWSYA